MKMKKKGICFLVALALVLAASGVAFAETVQGEVTSVDLTGKMLKVTKTVAATGAKEEASVWVSDTTTYSGEVTALAEVVEGDKVKLEVEKNPEGKWVAKSVEVSAAE